MKYVVTLILLLTHYTGYNPLYIRGRSVVPTKSEMLSEPLKTILNEVDTIKGFESFSSKPYRDVDGDWLIGYGFKKKFFYKPNRITKQQADSVLTGIMLYLYDRAKVNHPKGNKDRWVKIAHLYYWVGIRRTLELGLVNHYGTIRLYNLKSTNTKRKNYLGR